VRLRRCMSADVIIRLLCEFLRAFVHESIEFRLRLCSPYEFECIQSILVGRSRQECAQLIASRGGLRGGRSHGRCGSERASA
jgi:hypothetical protein